MNKFRENSKFFVVILLIVTNLFVWNIIFAEERDGILTVAFLDVGQGDSIFIEATSGAQILIDGGIDSRVLREISKQMDFHDREIDMVIATHPDSDHIGGLSGIFESYDVLSFVESGVSCSTVICESLNELIEKEGLQKILARRGTVFDLGDGVELEILFPDRDVLGLAVNDASIVAQLRYGKIEFLLTGDSPKKMEQYLVALGGELLESDVLKLGHHGSKTSSSEIFLGYVSPEYAVISAGKDNSYGHPHQEVLDLLTQFEIKPLGTYDKGTIIFETDGSSLWVD